jgi:hypothetical protein
MAPVIFHHSHPALCGSSGRSWAGASSWPSLPIENRCKRCNAMAGAMPGSVTITDCERVVWTGSYAEFQAANIDSLSVAEFCALQANGQITIGGGSAPLLMIACDSPLRRVDARNRTTDQ